MRKPVGIIETQNGWIIVVCDDGTLWRLSQLEFEEGRPWNELKNSSIPGTLADI